jgi:hypothetical protein
MRFPSSSRLLGKLFIQMVLVLAPRLILQPLDPQYVDGIHSHIRRQVCGLTSIEIIAATAFNHPFRSYLHLRNQIWTHNFLDDLEACFSS